MKFLFPAITFVLRHSLIVPLLIVIGSVLWTIAYVFLLLIAIIWDQGIGGPLAYPAGIIAIIGATIAIGWGVFTPASAIGAMVCGFFRLPRITAIPIVFGSAFVLSYLLYWASIGGLTTHSMPPAWVVLKHFMVFLSLPLGAYWWLTEGPGALFDGLRRWIGSRRQNKSIRQAAEGGN